MAPSLPMVPQFDGPPAWFRLCTPAPHPTLIAHLCAATAWRRAPSS